MPLQTIKIIAVVVIAILLFLSGGFTGYSYCKNAQQKGVIKQQKKDAEAVLKHIDKKSEVRKNVDTIIETKIKLIVDPTGCLDTGSPDLYLDSLQRADSTAKSGFSD